MKNDSRNSRVAADVPADDPVGTMDRFTEGLKRVLAAPKVVLRHKPRRRKRKRR